MRRPGRLRDAHVRDGADVQAVAEREGVFLHLGREQGVQGGLLLCREEAPSPVRCEPVLTRQVQSGGSFDVDYAVTGPNEKIIMDGAKERQGDFVFSAQDAGEYRFCFNNEMSTFADKFVDFEIAVRRPLFRCGDG